MLFPQDMRPREGIFTHVHADGSNIHIASNRVHDWVQRHKATLPTAFLPVEPRLARSFVTDNIVSLDRVRVLASRIHAKPLTPVIMAKDGTFTNGRPDVYFLDGHHRYVLYYMLKCPAILAYCLEVDQWKPFQVLGLPPTTRERLKAEPVTPRSY